MATYTGFGSGTPAGLSFTTDANGVSLGTSFKVTVAGLYLTKIRFYWPSGTNAGSVINCGLFATAAPSATGSVLTGTAGTITALANSWNEYTLPVPYALTQNFWYFVEVWTPATNTGYGIQPYTFNTSDVVVGPITFSGDAGVAAGTCFNGGFAYGASIAPVTGAFHSTWYGVDIEVSDLATSPQWYFTPPPGLIHPKALHKTWAKQDAGGALTLPTTINTTSTFPTPTVSTSNVTTVNPARLNTLSSFPAAAITRTETATPALLSTATTFHAPTVSTLSGVITGQGASIPGGFVQANDANLVTLATRFQVTASGYQAIRVRLYLPSGANTAPTTGYVGAIYSSGTTGAVGTPIAQANFGTVALNTWNEVTIPVVPLSASTDYYAAVFFPGGYYGFLANYFTSTISTNAGLLLLIGDTASSYDGAYAYATALATPNQHYNATFYGVDVAIAPSTPLPARINTTTIFPTATVSISRTATPSTITTLTTLPTVVQPNSLTHLVVTPGGRQSTTGNSLTMSLSVNANDVVVLCLSGGAGTNPLTVVTAGITWTERVHKDGATGTASIWTALFTSSATVSVAITAVQNYLSASVYNVQGYATPYYGTTGQGSTTTQNNTLAIFTSTGTASEGFVVTSDVAARGAITSSDLSIDQITMVGGISAASGYKALGAAGAATAVVDYGAASPSASWAALELRDISSQMPLPTRIQTVSTFPAASIHIAQTRTPATISTATTFPAVTVSNRHDSTVAATRLNTISTFPAAAIIHPVPAPLLRTTSTFPHATVLTGIVVTPPRLNTTTQINPIIPRLTYTIPGQSYGDAIYGLSYYSGGTEWTQVNGWQYVLLTAGFSNPDGSPASGWLEFNISSSLQDTGNGIIISPEPFRMRLDANGRVAVPLYSTDQHNITPTNWYWTVTEMIDGWGIRTINFYTPMSSPVLQFVTIG